MRVIDSHTAGEPTRVIISGGPDLGDAPISERLKTLGDQHDEIRRSVILEPRGSEALVGALLCPASDPTCFTGVIFFNNVGYLGMCGHGAMGVVVTLAWLGRVEPGSLRLETPSGVIRATLVGQNEVTIENVPSYRFKRDVEIKVEGLGLVRGDVVWGGNWFFLTDASPTPLTLSYERELIETAENIKRALVEDGITGADGAEIDHIELTGPPNASDANCRNFVLCPGGAYDRSPCGTGTSAKLACLAEDGVLAPGQKWVQESVIGSRFTASYKRNSTSNVVPSITGEAYVCADATLIRQDEDPFRYGIFESK